MSTVTLDSIRGSLGWPRPTSQYDDDGIAGTWTFDGHTFAVSDSGDQGFNSGRTRWRVMCATCSVEVHSGSTSATAQIRNHIETVKS